MMLHPHLTPKAIEELTGISPDVLRDWRRRGLIRGFGEEQANGRWLYSWQDVLTMASAQKLNETGIELKYCFWMAWNANLSILNAVRRLTSGGFYSRYHFFWLNKVGNPHIRSIGFELQHDASNDRVPNYDLNAPVSMTVDVEALVPALPHRLVECLRQLDMKGA